jgi:uncharacterized protein
VVKIDVFAHIHPPEYGRRVRAGLAHRPDSPLLEEWELMVAEDPALIDLDARWHSMDRFEGYRQVLVPGAPPIEALGGPAEVGELARELNDELAELVARYPERFVGFAAALPMGDDIEPAVAEVDRAVRGLGALGVQLYTNVRGTPLDRPEFEPVLDRVETLGAAVWLHPYRSTQWSDYPYGGEEVSHYNIYWTFGWPYETATAMARLVYSGAMERHSGLKVITHHGGGLIPHLAGRLREAPWGEDAEAIRGLPRLPIEYFRRFYADTAMMGASHAVRCAIDFFGIEHVLFGSDFGFGNDYLARTLIDITELGLDEADSQLLYEGNARRLLGLGVPSAAA